MHARARLRPILSIRRLAAAAVAVCLSTAGVIGLAGVASAHANKISGNVACQANGTYTVTWTVANDFNLDDVVTLVSSTGGGTLSGLPVTIPASPAKPYNTATVTQSNIPGSTTGSVTITVHGVWTDQVTKDDTGQVTLRGDCGNAPTFVDATCAAAGSYTIPATVKGEYFQILVGNAWTKTTAGTFAATAGQVVSIRLMKSVVGAPDQIVNSWTHTFNAPRACNHVTPQPPVLHQSACDGSTPYVGSITIPTVTGVVYMNGNSVVTGDIHGAGTYTITAVAVKGYILDGVTAWTLTINPAPVGQCGTPPPPPPASVVSVSGSIASSCPTVAGKTGSYVVTVTNDAASTKSVVARVSDGATLVATSGALAAGQHFTYTGSLSAGNGKSIKAESSSDGGTTWTTVVLSGTTAIVCPQVLGQEFTAPPAAPTQTLPFTGIPVLPAVLLALGLILGGAVLVSAARNGQRVTGPIIG